MYNFDKITDRKNTQSIKFDFAAERGKSEDILPLWVADMDFPAPPEVIAGLKERIEHGIFGYSECRDSYYAVLQKWFEEHYGYTINRDWVVKTPGVVYAIAMAIRAFTEEGESVLIQEPVYYPFKNVILENKRNCIVNTLYRDDRGAYQINSEAFEQDVKKNKVKLFILCNPHNPVARVWSKEDLTRLGNICKKYGVIVVSDEIHADFVYPPLKHNVFAGIDPSFEDITVTCTAPSKSFNLAGLQASNIIISNKNLRRKFKTEISRSGYSQLNGLGLLACELAYEKGGPWLSELKNYLQENFLFLDKFLKENTPKLKLVKPEGTYLAWVDCRELGISVEELEFFISEDAKLWLDGGTMFGESGAGYQRINIACPRQTLVQALEQLKTAYQLKGF